MNRFAKIMQGLGGLGIALLVAVWVQGSFVRDDAPQLALHSMVAIAAAGFCVLPRFWTMAYLILAASGRRTRRPAEDWDSAGAEASAAASARKRRLALGISSVALISLGGSFALVGAAVVHRASPLSHGIAGLLAIVLQVAALLCESRALLADAAEMRQLPDVARPAGAAS